MIAQHHHELVAEVGDQPLALIEIERDALIIVIGETAGELQRPLIERQQALLLAGDGDAGDRVRVQASDNVSRFVRMRSRNYFYRSLLDRLEPRIPLPSQPSWNEKNV